MPTPDASSFTQFKRLKALEARTDTQKTITHLYQPQVTTTGLTDFLPSFTNKFITGSRYIPIGFPIVNSSSVIQQMPNVPELQFELDYNSPDYSVVQGGQTITFFYKTINSPYRKIIFTFKNIPSGDFGIGLLSSTFNFQADGSILDVSGNTNMAYSSFLGYRVDNIGEFITNSSVAVLTTTSDFTSNPLTIQVVGV